MASMTTADEAVALYGSAMGHRDLPDGRIIVMYWLIFTIRICIGPQGEGWYDRAWCYEHENLADALLALHDWDGTDTPPGAWIKEVGT